MDLKIAGLPTALPEVAGWLAGDRYCEPFLRRLGADEISSFDNSSYEGAAHLHDMNQPIPDSFKGQFTTVIDGGSLEHIFNFPRAIQNCMEMVSVGGHFLSITGANNHMGHGFYQFSPELFFRVLSPANGFVVERMIFCQTPPGSAWYEVSDPEKVGWRVECVTAQPAYLMVMARRTTDVAALATTPQQSDYVATWNVNGRHMAVNPLDAGRGMVKNVKSLASHMVPRVIRQMIRSVHPKMDAAIFKKVDPLSLIRAGG